MSGESAAPLYRFRGVYVERRDDPYYVTRWDLAKPVSILAETKKEAYLKLWSLLGEPPHRNHHWVARFTEVEEVQRS